MICDVGYMCKSSRDRVTRTKVGNPSSSYHKPNSWHIGGSSQQAASKAEGTLGEELNDSSQTRMGAADRCCLCPVVRMLQWRTLSLKSHRIFLLPSGSLVFLLSLWFTSRSYHLYHTSRGRERKEWGGTRRPGLYTGIEMALVDRTVRKEPLSPSVSPGCVHNAGLAAIVSLSPACALELKNAWFY